MTGKDSSDQPVRLATSNSRNFESAIEGYMELTQNAAAPKIFREVVGVSGVLACLSRRCWVNGSQGPIYPPCSMIVVAPSGGGKGPAINPMEDMLHALDSSNDILHAHEGIHVGPSDATLAGLVDEYADPKSLRHFMLGNDRVEYNTVIVIAEELATFFHNLETQMMSYLCRLLDCRRVSQRLRSKGETTWIERPALHLLGGVQPKILTTLLPGQAFDMGVTTRTMFSYSNARFKEDPFISKSVNPDLRNQLMADLKKIIKLKGPFKVMVDAEERIRHWWQQESDDDAPKHPKLEHYVSKRIIHLFKLCMAFNAARSDNMIIELDDVEKALSFLRRMEKTLPEMFDSLSNEGASEDVFRDLAHQIIAEYNRTKKPIPFHVLAKMAAKKVKSYEIPGIIDQLVAQNYVEMFETKVGMITRKTFKPGTQNEF